ncbi:MAG: XdhC family protein, partial [Fimbriimonadaceae bacterium]|nr:XdhC family protein [Alphaproteobacteria bacterium]
IPDGAYIFVMTHSHALDLDLCQAALSQDRFAYVGVIGSKTKRARFEKRLRDEGLNAVQMDRFHSPLGLETIRGKEPSVIAISIAADLVQRIEMAGEIETGAKKGTEMRERYRESG